MPQFHHTYIHSLALDVEGGAHSIPKLHTDLTCSLSSALSTHLGRHTCSHIKTDSWSPTFYTFTQHHIMFFFLIFCFPYRTRGFTHSFCLCVTPAHHPFSFPCLSHTHAHTQSSSAKGMGRLIPWLALGPKLIDRRGGRVAEMSEE